MKLHIDKSGRIVFPKPLRDRLGLAAGSEVEAVEQPGGLLLRPAQQRPSMVQVDGFWIHQGTVEPGANWNRVLDDVRDERTHDSLQP